MNSQIIPINIKSLKNVTYIQYTYLYFLYKRQIGYQKTEELNEIIINYKSIFNRKENESLLELYDVNVLKQRQYIKNIHKEDQTHVFTEITPQGTSLIFNRLVAEQDLLNIYDLKGSNIEIRNKIILEYWNKISGSLIHHKKLMGILKKDNKKLLQLNSIIDNKDWLN